MDDVATVVIDVGSNQYKACYASDETPRAVSSSIVGLPKCGHKCEKELYAGNDVWTHKSHLNFHCPVDKGKIVDYDSMVKLWDYIFRKELYVYPEEHPVVLTESPLTSKYQRQEITQIMFETFNVPALYIANQAVMSLFASGRITGTVLESGDGTSTVVPVYEGTAVSYATTNLGIAGHNLTQNLHLLTDLAGNGYSFTSSISVRESVRNMKEQTCYVASDYEEEMKRSESIKTDYELPDGHVVTVGKERFECPEALFKPSGVYSTVFGTSVQEATFDSIMKCDADLRSDLYANIVVSGGNTQFPGFVERFQKEISNLVPHSTKANIFTPVTKETAVLFGGCILASLSDFEHQYMTREEYGNFGPSLVNRKCI